jgi:hypothetical protein
LLESGQEDLGVVALGKILQEVATATSAPIVELSGHNVALPDESKSEAFLKQVMPAHESC